MEELKTRSFRITDETANKIKELANEIEGNQQEVIAKLIETYEFQKGKTILNYKKDDIEKFEQYTSILVRMFMSSLEENQTITETVHTEFESQLKSKDFTIANLQKENEKLSQNKSITLEEIKIISEENNNLRKQLEVKQNEIEENKQSFERMLKDKEELNTILTSSVNEMKNHIKNMESKLSDLEEITKSYNDLESNLKIVELENIELEKELQTIKKQYEEITIKTKQEAEKILKSVIQKSELKHEKGLLQQEKLYQETFQKLKTDHQKEIDLYQKKYFDLVQTIQSNSSEIISETNKI